MNQWYQRKSPRLLGYDYTEEGAYFVTICVQNRLHLFGSIQDGAIQHTPAGEILFKWWEQLPHKFTDVEIDAFVVMPNHVHGIIVINRANTHNNANAVGAYLRIRPSDINHGNILKDGDIAPSLRKPTGLPEIMRWFKSMTTTAYIRGVKTQGWKRFEGKLWQRSYHDHIIRNEHSLNKLREYIMTNPIRWQEDTFYGG